MRLFFLALAILFGLTAPAVADISFWNVPRHGGNSFNGAPPGEAYFRALRATGATWVRLTFSKWKGEKRDFLIGDADCYAGIPPSDLATLIRVMDAAHAAGIKVVLVPLSLPGNRWNQHNGWKQDDRMWNDRVYWVQSAMFWRDLAMAVKDHPALAGYNLLNEPTPEKGMGLDEHAAPEVRRAWYVKYRDSTHDLPAFYNFLIQAIRSVDAQTPVMVDGGWYSNAWSFSYWPAPLADDKVLYAFHMYEPYEATSAPNIERKPQHRYPGYRSWLGSEQVSWDRETVARFLAGPFDWAAAHGIAANRMVAGEYGCVRQWADCAAYLNDVLDVLNRHGAHWAFYSFREDVWEAMDYEIPPDFPAKQFYVLMGQGDAAGVPRSPHPLMDVIAAHMK